jgi:uncharacterized protein
MMERRNVPVVKLLLLVVVLCTIGGAVALRLRARTKLRVAYAIGPFSTDAYAALATKPGWQAWAVTLPDGIVLKGLIHRPKNATAPWILFLPGNDPEQLMTGQRAVERMLSGDDWGAAVVAYRGYNGSGGVPQVDQLHRDGVSIYDTLRTSEHLSVSQLHIAGFSIGGNIACYVSSELARRKVPAPSLSLLAAANYFVLVRPGPFEKWVLGDTFHTEPLLSDVPAPVLVVQGGADEALLGPGQGRAIAAALGARAEYVELPGAGHIALLTDSAALSHVHTFVASHLQPAK